MEFHARKLPAAEMDVDGLAKSRLSALLSFLRGREGERDRSSLSAVVWMLECHSAKQPLDRTLP